MSATKDLRAEHVAIARMLDIVESMAARVRDGNQLSDEDVNAALEFFRVFQAQCHHAKEEVLLFPALAAAGVLEAQSATDELLFDHRRSRVAMGRMQTLADRLQDPDDQTRADFFDVVRNYSELTRGHILMEEARSFGPADERLTPEVQQSLVEGYEEIERDVSGDRHEEFAQTLERLEAKYLALAST